MTPVRNQGGCGSCWAFAAIGDMEAQYQISKHNPSTGVDLSEQNVLQCSGGSCSGWYLDGTLNYLKNSGTPDEACNPYNAADHACGTGRCSDYLSRTYKITDWTWISWDTATIKSYLYNHGPVMVWMPIFNDFPWWSATFWQYYYYGHDTSGSYDGHFVVIVGWNDAGGGYWIVRNSWGTSGGDVNDYGGGSHGGYFYMTMDPTTGFFGIYQEAAVISDITEPASNTVTFTTNPTGSGFLVVDGSPVTPPQVFSWVPGWTHAISAREASNAPFGGWSWSSGLSCSCAMCPAATVTVYGAGTVTANFGSPVSFDFRLSNSEGSSNLGGISVARGSSGSITITVSLVNGPAEPVTLSCSSANGPLPSGVSCSSASGTPPFTATVTVTVSSSTLPGYYTIKVIGAAGSLTRQTLFILLVT